jgi:hypothetical protein
MKRDYLSMRALLLLSICLIGGCDRLHPPDRTITPVELFDLSTKCSKLAQGFENHWRSEHDQGTLEFSSHFNPEDNKCYMEISGTVTYLESSTRQLREVWDVQENRNIARCDALSEKLPQCETGGIPQPNAAVAKQLMDNKMGKAMLSSDKRQ